MGFFSFFRQLFSVERMQTTVTFDDVSVTCHRSSGLVETVKWSDIHAVVIHTTDAGPAVDDVFYVLVGRNSGIVIPSEAVGMNQLFDRLQQLQNFDNETAIQAMSSTDNQEFLVWKKQEV